MPYPGALPGAQQTRIRAGGSFQRYLVLHPPSIMLQFSPSVNASGKNNAGITYATAGSGSHTNVLLGMLVIVSPTSDYADDLKNDYENCHVTYARAAATSTTLSIGMTNFQWTTGDTVTVLDTFSVHHKPDLVDGTTLKKDFNITFRQPLPRIYDLYWDIALSTNGTTADYSPTPSAESISSWSWQVIENGTLTHTSASSTPTFTLDVGTAWLHLTVTDSNGNTNWFAALIAVVPDNYSSVVHEAVIGTVTNDLSSGLSAALVAYGSVSNWVPGSAALVFLRALYNDGTIDETVEMAGWLAGAEERWAGDEQWGRTQEFSAQLVGVGERLRSIKLAGYPVNEKAGPAKWGEFIRVTPYDAIWYALSEHSTAANVAALDLPSNYTSYRWGQMDVPGSSMAEALNELSFRAEGGMVNWSPNGEIVLRKSLLYETVPATRDAATVYATYQDIDGTIIDGQLPPPLAQAFGTVQAGAASYNTTTRKPLVFAAQAPGGFVPGALQETIDGIILEANLSFANTGAAAGQLAANHFLAGNDSTVLDLDMLPGYHALVPSAFQWHKASFAAADGLFGFAFDTNDRCLCLSQSVQIDSEQGSCSVRVSLRKETDGGDNYAPEVEFLPTQTSQRVPDYPIASFYPGLSDTDLSTDTYGTGLDDHNNGWQDNSLPDEQAAEETYSENEVLRVPFRGGAVTSSALANGASYLLRISGEAKLTPGDLLVETQVDTWAVDGTTSAYSQSSVTTTNDVPHRVNIEGTIAFDGEPKFADGQWAQASGGDWGSRVQDDLVQFENGAALPDAIDETYNDAHRYDFARTGDGTTMGIRFSDPSAWGDNVGSFTATLFERPARRGDAFYQDYQDGSAATAYVTGKGLQIDSADPSPVPSYNGGHTYEYELTGDGTTVSFEFVDPDGDATDNSNAFITIEIIPQ